MFIRKYATEAKTIHDVLIVGAGTGGIHVANMIKQTFEANNKESPRISIIDKAELHHYQPGWTLVGAGMSSKNELNRPMSDTIPKHVHWIKSFVHKLLPKENKLITDDGLEHRYKSLVLAPGIKLNYDAVEGLRESMGHSGVSTIYDYDQCDTVWSNVRDFSRGKALFTFPAAPNGLIKCAGAPIKIAFTAEDYWRRVGRRGDISVEYFTSLPKMFGVQKYSDALKDLADKRGIKPYFQIVLKKVDGARKVATFTTPDGEIEKSYDFLHATPPMAPHSFIKDSEVSNEAGLVAVNEKTLQSTTFDNIWSLGDSSSLPTSKTAAAIMSQGPILAHNLYRSLEGGDLNAEYDGYTSCPLLVGKDALILAEFGYGGEIKETFAKYGLDQGRPSKWAYHLKKDLFPSAYFDLFTQGRWYGRNGLIRPTW